MICLLQYASVVVVVVLLVSYMPLGPTLPRRRHPFARTAETSFGGERSHA